MFNKIVLIGRLVADPKVQKSQKGNDVVTLRIASSTFVGNNNQETLYINVIVFGPLAEKCKTYLTKGAPVLVDGRLRYRQWETPNGKGSTYEIIANTIRFLPNSKDKQGSDIEKDPLDEIETKPAETKSQKPVAEKESFQSTSDEFNDFDEELKKPEYSEELEPF